MNEEEWLASNDPAVMLKLFDSGLHITSRKLRMFACACCLLNGASVEVVDGYEENGPPTDLGLDSDYNDWEWAHSWLSISRKVSQSTKAHLLRDIVGNPFRSVKDAYKGKVLIAAKNPKQKYALYAGIGLLPVVHYLTPQVLSLANAAYENRLKLQHSQCYLDPMRLLILADALEEVGCIGERCNACGPDLSSSGIIPRYWCGLCDKQTRRLPNPILVHLRNGGPHVRGCWALDLILGKE